MIRSRRWLLACFLLMPLLCMAAPASESAEIDALIARVAQARNVVFIRNGSTHTAGEAATHLQRKLRAAHGRIGTAEQFIEVLGTRSSLTGRVYRVRLADGHEIDSAVWLRQLLREIRTRRVKAVPPQGPAATWPSPAMR
jgi:hypothetical protein